MAKFRRISLYFIFVVIELHHLVYAQQKVDPSDPRAICQALEGDRMALCGGNTGRTTYASPGDCKLYFLCTGRNRFDLSCTNGELFDVTSGKCLPPSQNPYCYEPCDTYFHQTTSSFLQSTAYAVDAETVAENISEIFEKDMIFSSVKSASQHITTISSLQNEDKISTRTTPTTTTTTTPTTTTGQTSTTSKKEECVLATPCIPNQKVGHEDDCKIFFQCSTDGSSWNERRCTWFGTSFDTIRSSCASSASAKCQQGCPFEVPSPVVPSITTTLQSKLTSSFSGSTIGFSNFSTNFEFSGTESVTPNSSILTMHVTTQSLSSSINNNPTPTHSTLTPNVITQSVSNTLVRNVTESGSPVDQSKPCRFPVPCIPGQKMGDRDNCTTYHQCTVDGHSWIDVHCSWLDTKFDAIKGICMSNVSAVCQEACPFPHHEVPVPTIAPHISTTHARTSTEFAITTPHEENKTVILNITANSTLNISTIKPVIPTTNGTVDTTNYLTTSQSSTDIINQTTVPSGILDINSTKLTTVKTLTVLNNTTMNLNISDDDTTVQSGYTLDSTELSDSTTDSSSITHEHTYYTSIITKRSANPTLESDVSVAYKTNAPFTGNFTTTVYNNNVTQNSLGITDKLSTSYATGSGDSESGDGDAFVYTKDHLAMFSSTNIPLLHDNQTMSIIVGNTTIGQVTNQPLPPVTTIIVENETIGQFTNEPLPPATRCIPKVPCTPSETVGDPLNCQSYYQCSSSGTSWTHITCTWAGTRYDVIRGSCATAAAAQCQTGCPFLPDTKAPTVLPPTPPQASTTKQKPTTTAEFITVPITQDVTQDEPKPTTAVSVETTLQRTEISTTEKPMYSTVVASTFGSNEVQTTEGLYYTSEESVENSTTGIPSSGTSELNGMLSSEPLTKVIASTKQPTITITEIHAKTTPNMLTDVDTIFETTEIETTINKARTTTPEQLMSTTIATNKFTATDSDGLFSTKNIPMVATTIEGFTTPPAMELPTTLTTKKIAMVDTTIEGFTTQPVMELPTTLTTKTIAMVATTIEGFTTQPVMELPTTLTTKKIAMVATTIEGFTTQPAMELPTTQDKLADEETTVVPEFSTTETITAKATTMEPVIIEGITSEKFEDDVTTESILFTSDQNFPEITTAVDSASGTTIAETGSGMTTVLSDMTTASEKEIQTTTTLNLDIDPCNRSEECFVQGVRVSDPDNCNKYYECNQIVNQLRWKTTTCQGQTLFDKTALVCTSDLDVRCQEPCEVVLPSTPQQPTPAKTTTVPAPAPSTSIPATEEPGVITKHSVIVRSTGEPVEGSSLSISCSFTVIPNTVESSVMWYLNGMLLRNSERILITRTMSLQQSTLTFNPLHALDKGKVSCVVKLNNGQESTKIMPVDVIERLKVNIDLLSITITSGTPLRLVCVAPKATNTDEILWYKNGLKINSTDAENIITMVGMMSELVSNPSENVIYSCAGLNKAGIGEEANCLVTVTTNEDEEIMCEYEYENGVNWTMTLAGEMNIQRCPNNMIGQASRECLEVEDGDEAVWAEPNFNHCVDREFIAILQTVQRIEEGIGGSSEALAQVTMTLENVTSGSAVLSPGNLNASVEAIDQLSQFRKEYILTEEVGENLPLTIAELNSMVNTISNLLDDMNADSWNSVQQENANRSVSVMNAVDAYRETAASQLGPEQLLTVASNNLVLQAECFTKDNIREVKFPRKMKDLEWMEDDLDSIVIQRETLASIKDSLPGNNIAVSSSYYKNIDNLLPNYNMQKNNTDAFLNSKVLAVSVNSLESGTLLQPSVELVFEQDEKIANNLTANCSFWDFEQGVWSTDGCRVVHSNSSIVTCQCDHLTNFAVLVSRKPVTGIHAYILGLISIIGCVISIGGMVLTILIYISIWKHVKSHHAVVLLNLCVCLIIANLVFVTGVDKTQTREVCIAVAVLLHYFFLAAFCLMLVEGIQLILYIIYVFHVRRKRETASLIVLGWVVPAIIVAICLGITRTDGYGNEDFCWLDPNSWLFWSFIVPVGVILIINTIILICVLKRISTSKIHQIDKNRHQKIRSSMWNIVVVMPILGITWFFGVFSVNSDILAFQYIFAISNSLQGLFIFIFHALCNKKAIGRRKSGSGSTLVKDTLTTKKGSTPTITSSGLLSHFLPGKKGRYHVKSSTKTQRSRLKSDSSGKNSNKSTKSSKSSKSSKDKKKNSLSTETPPYDTIPADFMDFDESAYKPQPHTPEEITFKNINVNNKFVIENEYMVPENVQAARDSNARDQGGNGGHAGYHNLTFNTFGNDAGHDPNQVSINLNASQNASADDTISSLHKHMNFFERLNSVSEMRSEEYMDVKLSADKVRFKDSPRHTPKSSPFLPRSTPFLARQSEESPQLPVKAKNSFNC